MSRCRRTDAMLDIVADPDLGVDALTDEHWQHIGICADCTTAVRGMQRLDGALTAALRRVPHEDLPPSVLATPGIPRAPQAPRLAPLLAAAAVIVLAIGLTVGGLQWFGVRGVGVDPSSSATPQASPAASSSPAATTTPAPDASPTAVPPPVAEPPMAALTVGELAAVVDEPLVVRTAPGTDPDSTLTEDRLWIGQRVWILDGPADVDGYTWWEVEVGEIRGWVADGERDESAPWLAPIANGDITFWRHPGEGGVGAAPLLFSIRADGSGERELGDPTAALMRNVISCGFGTEPLQWTHDGRWAAFGQSPGGCDRDLYAMPADGSEFRKLADGWGPAWRPDGVELAFAPNAPYLAIPEPGAGEIMVVGLDTAPQALTDSGIRLNASWPSWAPDRTRLAYTAGVPSEDDLAVWEYEIRVADVDTGEGRAVADGMRPRWSPDGRWIVFERPVDDVGTMELWRGRPDGSAVERLGQGSAVEFSPDGGRLAFVGDGGVWTMAIDGSEASRAIPATFVEGLAWSPDGTSLVVASNYGGGEATGLSIVRIDGAAPAITGIAAQGHAPSWQPLLLDARLGR